LAFERLVAFAIVVLYRVCSHSAVFHKAFYMGELVLGIPGLRLGPLTIRPIIVIAGRFASLAVEDFNWLALRIRNGLRLSLSVSFIFLRPNGLPLLILN